MMHVWRLSVAYIGPKSRTERPRKTKIGTEVGHVSHTWLGYHFQGQKVKGQLAGAGHIVAASHTACWIRVDMSIHSVYFTVITLLCKKIYTQIFGF